MALQSRRRQGGGPLFELGEAGTSSALVVSGVHRHQQHQQPHQQHQQPHQQHAHQQQLAPLGPQPPVDKRPPRPKHHPASTRGAADRLNAQLHSIEAGALAGVAVPTQERACLGERLRGLALRVYDATQPSGPAPGDETWGERTVNVLTSLPFLAVGWRMHKRRLTAEGRHHALTLVAVGAAATLYHATSGRARRAARKVDYWTIAYSSSALVKCIHADSPGVRRAATLSLLAVPFKPFAVSCVHAWLMQVEFLRQAVRHKAVRADLQRHYAAAALGVGAFFFEDAVMYSGWGGYVHAAWHCLACYGVATMDGLLAHKERQHLQARLRRAGDPCAPGLGAGAAGKPLRRPVHSSASSLPSYGGYSYGGKLGGGSPAGLSPEGSSPAGSSPRALSPPPRFAVA